MRFLIIFSSFYFGVLVKKESLPGQWFRQDICQEFLKQKLKIEDCKLNICGCRFAPSLLKWKEFLNFRHFAILGISASRFILT
jgi:hypothetical protein